MGGVLHLDLANHILEDINTSSQSTRTRYISSFYDVLSRITTTDTDKIIYAPASVPKTEESNDDDIKLFDFDLVEDVPKKETVTPNIEVPEIEIQSESKDNDIELFDLDLVEDAPKKETVTPNIEVSEIEILSENKDDDIKLFDLNPEKESLKTKTTTKNIDIPEVEIKPEATKKAPEVQQITTFGDIDLSDVKPIHFDFQISAAAEELSLPESLIEEFMVDFVEQAHSETDNMLRAYKEGDLKTVNKIGHLLKGVSSNLRIIPLSETLYKIQFCEEPNDLKNLIEDYWGHFLFFEKQINTLSN